MPLPPPSFDDDYALLTSHPVSRETFNVILADIAARLRAAAAGIQSIEEITQAEIDDANALITDTVTPIVASITATLNAIGAQLVTAQGQLEAIQNGGVLAENVQVANGSLWFEANLDEALAALEEYTTAVAALKVDLSSKASIPQAQAGVSDDTWMTPATTVSAISEQSGGYQEFLTSGTWTKPPLARWVEVEIVSPGGGGGSGRREAASTVKTGGGGGGGGAKVRGRFNAADLGGAVTVTLGAPGTGGVAQTVNSSAGNNGGDGGATSFGAHLVVAGGKGGVGGATVAPSQPGASWPGFTAASPSIAYEGATAATMPAFFGGAAGGLSSALSGTGGGSSQYAGGGGGGGGSENSTNVLGTPGAGGTTGSIVQGAGAAAGTSHASAPTAGANGTAVGMGGGGGGSSQSAAAAPGGAGGRGAGGGGGGSSRNGFNSGAGGNGGPGRVRIWWGA